MLDSILILYLFLAFFYAEHPKLLAKISTHTAIKFHGKYQHIRGEVNTDEHITEEEFSQNEVDISDDDLDKWLKLKQKLELERQRITQAKLKLNVDKDNYSQRDKKFKVKEEHCKRV